MLWIGLFMLHAPLDFENKCTNQQNASITVFFQTNFTKGCTGI